MNLKPNDSQFSNAFLKPGLTPKQVAEIMEVSVSTVYAWISRREIASTKVGNSRFVTSSQLSAFANGRPNLDLIDYTYSNRVMR